MFFKDNYHKAKKFLLIIFLFLMASVVWNQIYLESQNFLLNNPNWYSYRSTFVDTHATTFELSMGRLVLAARELNLSTSKRSDMILTRHEVILKDLEFTFRIPNNSHLDLLYNFKDGASSFIRLSRSSLYESGIYKINARGIYSQFRKIDFGINSEKEYRGHLQETDKGITLSVDNKIVAVSLGDKFEKLEFGFESGMIGVYISNIIAYDVNGNIINTYLDNNSGWFKFYLKNLLVGAVLLLAVFVGALVLKNNGLKTIRSCLLLINVLGFLWFIYDFYYYARKPIFWDRLLSTTRFYATPEENIDFEFVRWHFFSSWTYLLGGKTIHQVDYEKRFGKFFENYPLDYCLNSKCTANGDKEKLVLSNNKKQTIRLALIGESTTDSTAIRPGESSTFVEMHKTFYEKNSEKFNVESFNFSRTALSFKNNRDEIIDNLSLNKINAVVMLLKIRKFTSNSEFLAFENFLNRCKILGVKIFHINNLHNPEKIVDFTQRQVKDILKVDLQNHEKHNRYVYPVFDRFRKTNLFVLEPIEIFYDLKNIRNGKIWWDSGHFTSYGHELFGKWIGSKINNLLEFNDEK